MFTMGSLTFFMLSIALCVVAAQPRLPGALMPCMGTRSRAEGRSFYILAFLCIALGILARFYRLGAMPAGISAQDALVGANASALLLTGRDITGKAWPAQISLWNQQSTGALLSYIAIPFIHFMGLSLTAIRLPLAILSTGGVAAYALLVKKMAGAQRAACATALFALSPFYVMGSRWAVSDFAFIHVLLIALALGVYAKKRNGCLIFSMLCLALLPYAHRLGIYIAPLCAAVTLIVCVAQGNAKSVGIWIGAGIFAVIYGYAAMDFTNLMPLKTTLDYDTAMERALEAFKETFVQYPQHENMARENFSSVSSLCAYPFATVLAFVGTGYALNRMQQCMRGRRLRGVVVLLGTSCAGALTAIIYTPSHDILTACVLMPFFSLAVAAGISMLMRRVRFSGIFLCLIALFSFAEFSGEYFSGTLAREKMNGFFPGWMEAANAIREAQEEKAYETICVTADVYPHEDPENALKMMLVVGFDDARRCVADPQAFSQRYRPVYDVSEVTLDASSAVAYILRTEDIAYLEPQGYAISEYGDYAVLIAK